MLVIDVSNNQGAIAWDQVAADQAKVAGALMKRSQGTNFSDQRFPANWAGAKAHGLWRAAYHFSVPTANTPESEADYFLSQITLGTYDGAALDYEPEDTYWQLHPDDWMLRYCRRTESAAGVVPLIYTTKSIAARVTNPALARYPLWLACLEATIPASIGVWPSVALWQYSWTGRVSGISGDVDLNRLERDVAGLRTLGKPAPKPPVWHVTHTCALKPETQASHSTASSHTCFGGDVVVPTSNAQIVVSPITHAPEQWSEVKATGKDGKSHIGFVLTTNLYQD